MPVKYAGIGRRHHGIAVTDSVVRQARHRARNKSALILFGRAVVSTMAVVSGWLGFLTGVRLQSSNYDPYAYGTGVGALFAAACAVIALMLMRQRTHTRQNARARGADRGAVRRAIGSCARRKSARAVCWKRKAT